MTKKIIFLTPYPSDTAGSQRFRFEQYMSYLAAAGYSYECQSFLSKKAWKILYLQGHTIRKALEILIGFARRKTLFLKLHRYDFVFIHREASPVGPPIFEWMITKLWKKKIIYDFDDAIWLTNTSKENNLISKFKFPTKVNAVMKWSHKVSAGNQYLMDHASCFGRSVVYNPTTIDTESRHIPKRTNTRNIVIGWTGTHSTLKYLEQLRKPLEVLAQSFDFTFLVIADKPPEISFPHQQYLPWNKDTEIEDLNRIDIGVMPLQNDAWAQGKCGFKALQFMALEKPVLVSPVGVNADIVAPDVHGDHCRNEEDWIAKLEFLFTHQEVRQAMGHAGRQKVIEHFSVVSNQANFLSLFE